MKDKNLHWLEEADRLPLFSDSVQIQALLERAL